MFKGSEIVYYLMYFIGFAVALIINYFRSEKDYGIARREAVVSTIFSFFAGIVGALFMGLIYTRISFALGGATVSYVAIFGAVVFSPLIMISALKVWKKDVGRFMDMLTPGVFIVLTFAKLGCFINGCCAGFEHDHGLCIYNPSLSMKVFPVQIFEVLTMALIIAVTQLIVRKADSFVSGAAFPLTAAFYSLTRFFWEFARYYPASEPMGDMLFGLSFWQICCAFVFLASVLSLVLIKLKVNKKLTT